MTETHFAWKLPGGELSYAGSVDDFLAISGAVLPLVDDPAWLERSVAQALGGDLPRRQRAALEQLLYVVLCRPGNATGLHVGYVPTQEEADEQSRLLERVPEVIQVWEALTEKSRRREYLLLCLDTLLREKSSVGRDAKLRFLCGLLVKHPA